MLHYIHQVCAAARKIHGKMYKLALARGKRGGSGGKGGGGGRGGGGDMVGVGEALGGVGDGLLDVEVEECFGVGLVGCGVAGVHLCHQHLEAWQFLPRLEGVPGLCQLRSVGTRLGSQCVSGLDTVAIHRCLPELRRGQGCAARCP